MRARAGFMSGTKDCGNISGSNTFFFVFFALRFECDADSEGDVEGEVERLENLEPGAAANGNEFDDGAANFFGGCSCTPVPPSID